uniref:Ig-like domain-containing protein n=1 Tax=Sus scrofa TaxID=9823 RepID=A0A8D0YJG8_PIG
MEPPSAPAHGGRISWHRLLLAVSLLSFWNLPATAQITIESVPFNVAEGSDVLLLAHNATEDTLGYSWYRGERVENNQLIILYRVDIQANTTGPAYSGREIIYPNGSLLFQNATQNDTGYYTLMVTKNDLQREIVTGLLRVYPPVTKPIIEANSTTVTEQKDTVVLTCIINDTEVSIRWLFNGQSLLLTERIKLSQENSTLTIEPVRREDAGHYQCEASHPGNSSLSDPLRLDVKFDSIPGSTSGVSDRLEGQVTGMISQSTNPQTSTIVSHSHVNYSPNKIDEVTYSSLNFNAQESKKHSSASPPSPTATEMIHSEVKKKERNATSPARCTADLFQASQPHPQETPFPSGKMGRGSFPLFIPQ